MESVQNTRHSHRSGKFHALKAEDGVIINFVATDMNNYRCNTCAVKKTVSLPAWLAEEAEERNLSLSKILQDGIKAILEQ